MINSLPVELKRQVAERTALIADMMANGAITTPVEFLETPVLLVMHLSDQELHNLRKRLMRTRKRHILFSLNGRAFLPTRKEAVAVVDQEIKVRGSKQ